VPDRSKPSTRTLVVVRHSKAEQAGPTDLERELTPRGRRDAVAAGSWLSSLGVVPETALVSAATRTRQTWAAAAEGAGWELEPTFDQGLYAAGPDTVLDLLRTLDDGCTTAVVIGHNPTMAVLAQLLDDGEGDTESGTAMALGFPTSAVAVFAYDGEWVDLAPGSARVAAFHVARG
jgi:phosphohistidine phosphatase